MKKDVVIHGIKVEGKKELLRDCKFFIYTWDGYTERLFKAKDILASRVHITWFEQADKGGPSLFGINKDGKVICSLLYYVETDRYNNKVNDIEIGEAKKANPWG